MRTRRLVTFILLAATALLAHGESAVIQIRSQPAAALVNTIRPLVGPNGSVSAYHDKLIVSGTPAQIANVQSMLKQLDQPPRRLIIEVRQAGNVSSSRRDIGYGVNTENVRLGRVPPGSQGQITYQQAQTRGHDDSLQRVQALDGRPALIRAGQSVPVYSAHQEVVGNSVVQGFNVQYRDTGSGFYAVPRVHGNQVTIEIHQQHSSAAPNGYFNNQEASTVLQGGLGQWLVLGSIGGDDSNNRNELGRHVQTHRSTDRSLELRVLPVD